MGVSVTDVHKFPELVDKLIAACSDKVHHLVKVLRTIYDHRDTLGFMILNLKQIADLHVALKNLKSNQTPYIPKRINNLHLERSMELVNDFNVHSHQFEQLFEEAWGDTYTIMVTLRGGVIKEGCLVHTPSALRL